MQSEHRNRFACLFCEASFGRKEHKLRHEQSHLDTPRTSFKCSSCPRTFLRKDVLTRHERCVHHIVKPTHRRRVSRTRPLQSQAFQEDQLTAINTCDVQATESLRPATSIVSEIETEMQSNWDPPRNISFDYNNIGMNSNCVGPLDALFLDSDYSILPDQSRTLETEITRNDVGLNLSGAINSITPTTPNDISASFMATEEPGPAVAPFYSNSEPVPVDRRVMDPVAIRYPIPGPTDLPTPPSSYHTPCETSTKLLELVESSAETQSHLPTQPLLDDMVMVQLQIAVERGPRRPQHQILPGKGKCQRYMRFFFQSFHAHMPLMHIPTFQARNLPSALLLSMLAIGALYSFDTPEAQILHSLSKAAFYTEEWPETQAAYLQTLLMICYFAHWSDDAGIRSDGLNFQARLARELRPVREDLCSSQCHDWQSWVKAETQKRAILGAVIFIGLVNASSMSDELSIRSDYEFEMPYEETLWFCPSADAWKTRHSSVRKPKSFKTAFHNLFSAPKSICVAPSAFSHLALMHTLCAHVRRSRVTTTTLPQQLAVHVLQSVSVALERWLLSIKELCATSEAVSRENPSLMASGIILWEVACVYLHADTPALANAKAVTLGLVEDGRDRNPLLIRTQRSSSMATAAKHTLVFVRGPISSGINLLKTTGSINMNPSHCFLGYHCIVLLIRWLYTIEYEVERGANCRKEEQTVLDAVTSLIEDSGIDHIHGLPLSKAVAAVWAEVLNSSSRIWGIEKLLGKFLATSVS